MAGWPPKPFRGWRFLCCFLSLVPLATNKLPVNQTKKKRNKRASNVKKRSCSASMLPCSSIVCMSTACQFSCIGENSTTLTFFLCLPSSSSLFFFPWQHGRFAALFDLIALFFPPFFHRLSLSCLCRDLCFFLFCSSSLTLCSLLVLRCCPNIDLSHDTNEFIGHFPQFGDLPRDPFVVRRVLRRVLRRVWWVVGWLHVESNKFRRIHDLGHWHIFFEFLLVLPQEVAVVNPTIAAVPLWQVLRLLRVLRLLPWRVVPLPWNNSVHWIIHNSTTITAVAVEQG